MRRVTPVNYIRLDLRKDIALLCQIDCTTPPGRNPESLRWQNGDHFENYQGWHYRYDASIRAWMKTTH